MGRNQYPFIGQRIETTVGLFGELQSKNSWAFAGTSIEGLVPNSSHSRAVHCHINVSAYIGIADSFIIAAVWEHCPRRGDN